MKLSNYYLQTFKENPAGADIISHQYSLRACMVKQISSGLYAWLPLGLRVLKKIENIVRSELNKLGCLEVLMPCIQPASLWQESGRYDVYGKEMLKMKDRHNTDMLFGPTHEEVITDIIRGNISSYKSLPLSLYQIQWKFRDEIRPRFGTMRAREFLMKDAYSFDISEEMAIESYNKIYKSYFNIFKKMGLMAVAVKADTGQIGGNLSHEFHVVSDVGESKLYYDSKLDNSTADQYSSDELQELYAAADEMHDPLKCPIPESELSVKRGIEVGHVFYFGTKYSQSMGAKVLNKEGKQIDLCMGSYGIGISRLFGAIIEVFHDNDGILWPEEVAPFKIGLLNLQTNEEACNKLADDAYSKIRQVFPDEVLYDDRADKRAGEKFADMDLIGLPWQVIIGKKNASQGLVELKNRRSQKKEIVSLESAISKLEGCFSN